MTCEYPAPNHLRQRKLSKAKRDRLRDAKVCINTPNPPKPAHGPVYKGGRCRICYDIKLGKFTVSDLPRIGRLHLVRSLTMKLLPVSHLDHDLTADHITWMMSQFGTRDAFFIESVILPPKLLRLRCGLYGPTMGDATVVESEVTYAKRGDRQYMSRLIAKPSRPTDMLTVIAGPYTDPKTEVAYKCVLHTAFGGPAAPQEVGELVALDAIADDAFERAAAAWKDAGKRESGPLYEAAQKADAELETSTAKLLVSRNFWREHALARLDTR